jgi:hypothetical protein
MVCIESTALAKNLTDQLPRRIQTPVNRTHLTTAAKDVAQQSVRVTLAIRDFQSIQGPRSKMSPALVASLLSRVDAYQRHVST